MPTAQVSNVNFIPEEVLQERRKKANTKNVTIASVVLAVICVVIGVFLLLYNAQRQNELDYMDSQISRYKKEVSDLREFGVKGYGLGVRLGGAKDVIDNAYNYSVLLSKISATTPKNVVIKSYSVNLPDSISVSAMSYPNYTPISEFQKNLIEDELFKDVKITSASLSMNEKQSVVDFGLKIVADFDKLHEQTD